MATIRQLLRNPRVNRQRINRTSALVGCPQRKGVCLRVYTTTPKKPNSAIRKVAKIRLTTGKKLIVYVPGQGHNLQEHSVVLIRGGRVRDVPGVRYKIIRGKYDFIQKERFSRAKRRSKFSTPKS